MMDTTTPWAHLGGLMLAAQRRMAGRGAGRHASLQRGHGLDFHDYQLYTPGDDPADVDWKLYGRTDRLYVRRQQQPSNLHVLILVDASRSMDYPPADSDPPIAKWRYAALLGAAVATLAIRGGDRPALGLCGERLSDFLPPGASPAHLRRLCIALESAAPDAPALDWAASMKQAHAVMQQARAGFRGMLVVIGDLLDDPAGLFDGLARFGHRGFDTVVLQVLTPQELRPSHLPAGPLRLRDPERGVIISAHGQVMRTAYQEELEAHLRRVESGCRARGARYFLTPTDEPLLAALRRTVATRG